MIPELKEEIKKNILDFQDINRLAKSDNVEQSLHFRLGAIAALKQVLSKMDYLVKDDMALLNEIGSELKWLQYSINQFKKYPQSSFHEVIILRSCDNLKYYCETMLYRIEDRVNEQ
jgi:hypothetical protein